VALAVFRGAVERRYGSGVPIGAVLWALGDAADDNFEIGAAATVHPNSARILTPGAAFHTFGFAAAFDKANCGMRTGVAEAAVHIVGRAIDIDVVGLVGFVVVLIAANFKFCTAAAIDPNAAVIVTPGRAIKAIGFAPLAEETNAAGSVCLARVPAHIVGRARYNLRLQGAIVANGAEVEVCAAALIYPDAAARVAPSAAEDTVCATALTGQANAYVGASRTEMATTVVGRAINFVAAVPAVPGSATDLKFGAATAIHPNTAGLIAPGAAKDAGGAADLTDELCAAAGVDFASVALHVVGRAGDGLRLRLVLRKGTCDHAGRASQSYGENETTENRCREGEVAFHGDHP
jgi:hypothetical protein